MRKSFHLSNACWPALTSVWKDIGPQTIIEISNFLLQDLSWVVLGRLYYSRVITKRRDRRCISSFIPRYMSLVRNCINFQQFSSHGKTKVLKTVRLGERPWFRKWGLGILMFRPRNGLNTINIDLTRFTEGFTKDFLIIREKTKE